MREGKEGGEQMEKERDERKCVCVGGGYITEGEVGGEGCE